jgi:hypothetical protein
MGKHICNRICADNAVIRIAHFNARLPGVNSIEMLRAYKPDTFKTPGTKVNVNNGNQIFGGRTIIDIL